MNVWVPPLHSIIYVGSNFTKSIRKWGRQKSRRRYLCMRAWWLTWCISRYVLCFRFWITITITKELFRYSLGLIIYHFLSPARRGSGILVAPGLCPAVGVRRHVFLWAQKLLVNFFFNSNMTFLAAWGCANYFLKMLPKFKWQPEVNSKKYCGR